MTEPVTRLHVVGPGDSPAAAGEFHRPRTSWTADELMALEFAPPRWAVPGISAWQYSNIAAHLHAVAALAHPSPSRQVYM